MRTLLFIQDTICTSLSQLKEYFTECAILKSDLCDELLRLQRDGEIYSWLSEGNTEEEIYLAKEIDAIPENLSNDELLSYLLSIFGVNQLELPKANYKSFCQINNIRCQSDQEALDPVWFDSKECFFKIEPRKKTITNTLITSIQLSIDFQIKKVDNLSFNVSLIEKTNSKENNKVLSQKLLEINNKHVGDIVSISFDSVFVGINTDIFCLQINEEIIYTINLTKIQKISVGNLFLNMVKVSGGSFQYSNSITYKLDDFYICETPVTQELWEFVMKYNPSNYQTENNYPVSNVSYNDCIKFIDKLNDLTKMHFCIPSELEWEYAAKGGNKTRNYIFSGSDNFNDIAINKKERYPVRTKKPNELGLYDMSGLIQEWCSDAIGLRYERYSKSIRGGCFCQEPEKCEVICKGQEESIENKSSHIGFRLALREIDKVSISDKKDTAIQLVYKGQEMSEREKYTEAINLFRMAAQKGCAAAQYNLATFYHGIGAIQKDDYQAFCLYEQSAKQNYLPALIELATFYGFGWGCLKSEEKRFECYLKAAELGDPEGQFAVGLTYWYGNKYNVNKDQIEANFWFKKAAERGHGMAQYRLAHSYKHGIAIEHDETKADFWYKKAASQGIKDIKLD